MCRSTMVEWPTERYQSRGVPVYLQETLEDPAVQRASPILARTLYFPTSSTALYLSVLPSMPALYLHTVTPVTSDRVWLVVSFYVAYC